MREIYLVQTVNEALILLLALMLFPNNEITMNYFFATNLLCSLVAVLTNPSPKLATADSGDNTGKAQSDMINNYYSQGHCKKMEQHLLEIKQEIRTMKEKPWNFRGKVSKNCAEVFKSGGKISGLYKIDPDGLGEFEVCCDQKTAGGGWTVIQRRQDGSVDFYRGWNDYKLGFGNLNGEFWLGLDKIHRLTAGKNKKLRVDLEATAGTILLAEYSSFAVANEKAKYQLTVGGYSGNAGDSLATHNGMFFTTKDSDNDKWSKNCASSWKGAWWYNGCYSSNLNAMYLYSKSSNQGMAWMKWKNNYFSFKRSEMKIRPNNF